VNRDYAQIRKTAICAGDSIRNGDLDAFAKDVADAELGIEAVTLLVSTAGSARWIEDRVAPAIQRLAEFS
jgi:hypothetical protein